MTINVIQHDDRLLYLRLFYNGASSIASKNDLDDQNLLLATVHVCGVWTACLNCHDAHDVVTQVTHLIA
jgi:hypothetical protein